MVWLILGIVPGLYLGAKFHAKLMPMVTTIDSWFEAAKKTIMKESGVEKPQHLVMRDLGLRPED